MNANNQKKNTQDIIKKDTNDFTKQLNLLDSNTDIMKQLPSYNMNETDYFIRNLETELDQQKTLKLVLENKNFDEQIKDIKSFVKENSHKIDEQLDNLKNVSANIQTIVNENKKLQDEKTELNDILNSVEYCDIANKLREIKTEKEKIKIFLEKNGIISLI